MHELQTALIYVVPFLLVITVVVVVHELGHFMTARAFGVAVDQFPSGSGEPSHRGGIVPAWSGESDGYRWAAT